MDGTKRTERGGLSCSRWKPLVTQERGGLATDRTKRGRLGLPRSERGGLGYCRRAGPVTDRTERGGLGCLLERGGAD